MCGLSDVNIWKFYNVQKASLTREGFISELILRLMPKKNQINDVLINDGGEISTFNFPFSPYSKETAFHLSSLRHSKKEIIEYLKKYNDVKIIPKLIHTQYNVKLTIQEQKELLKK